MSVLLRRLLRPNIIRKVRQCAILSLPIAHCALDQDNRDFKVDLSHDALIKQACILSVNSSSQLLTQVLIAIAEASEVYRKSILQLMQILDDSILILTSGNSQQQEEISEMILIERITVEKHQKALRELVSLMEYVEKLATSTAETAFLAGAENSSTIICERLNSALQKIKEEQDANKKAEEELLSLQQSYINEIAALQKRIAERNKENEDQVEDKMEDTNS